MALTGFIGLGRMGRSMASNLQKKGINLSVLDINPEPVADLERLKPILDAMGTTVLHCGQVGGGVSMKLVNNYLCIVSCQMNAEALALSQRFGLELEKALEVLDGTTGYNGQLQLN